MSDPTTPAANPFPAVPPPPPPPQRRQIVIVSHSTLFYWWPVWAIGFLMTGISFFGDRLASVPNGTHVEQNVMVTVDVKGKKEKEKAPRDVLVFPENIKPTTPHMHIAKSKNVGVVFVAVLLLVIAITNIPLRGLWSFIVILFVLFFTIIFAIMDWWATIFDLFTLLDIRINMAGYFVISSVLFVLWLFVFIFFDRQIYMVFEPGQLRVRQAIGDAETTYDTTGMTTMKQRSDLFRHWVLGLGSGDLIVKTSGANATEIHMNNVLFIGYKHNEIEELLRSREVHTSPRAS